MLYRVEGIVIRSRDYGEGNKIVTLFTKQLGKINVMARGAKKLKSRYSAVTQLFTYGDFVLYKGASGQMGTLNQAEAIVSHHGLREELHLAAHSSYVAELVDRLTADEEPHPMLFEQLQAALAALEEGKDPSIVMHIMEMKLLALAGYFPEMHRCVSCGAEQGEMAFSAASGGVLCPRCRGKDPQASALSDGALKLLRLLQRVDLRRLGSIEVRPATKAQLKLVMRQFMDTHLDVRWKSRDFLDQIGKYDL